MCDGLFRVYTAGHRGCSQQEDRCGHEERQQEWIDVKLQYLLQLRHSIVTCVCIHMMRDELESSESHDKVPTLLTALSGYLSHYQRLGELFEELSVVSDQIHSLHSGVWRTLIVHYTRTASLVTVSYTIHTLLTSWGRHLDVLLPPRARRVPLMPSGEEIEELRYGLATKRRIDS